MIKSEWLAVFKERKLLIPIIAVVFIPVLYSAMFLWAFWDPYEKLGELPVAVVNEDKGAVISDKKIHIGDEMADKLRENDNFGWEFVSYEEAMAGFNKRHYYMMVRIPENFSEHAGTVLDEEPKKAVIEYIPNESLNFLSAQIGETAIEKLKMEVSEQLTKTYAETVFESIGELQSGLVEASDGAGQIADGTVEAKDGANKIASNLTVLASKSSELNNGMQKANKGYTELYAGMKELQVGTNELLTGLTEKTTDVNQLAQGAGNLQEGATELSTGLAQLHGGFEKLLAGAEQTKQGASQLASNMDNVEAGLTKTESAAKQLASGLNEIAGQNEALASDPQFKQLVALASGVASGTTELKEGQQAISQGANQLIAGQKELTTGMEQFSTKLKEANAGGEQLAVGSSAMNEGVSTLAEGWGQVVGGVQQLVNGENQLLQGGEELASGLGQLATGTSALKEGASDLTEGAHSLQDGMNELSDGTNELAIKLAEGAEEANKVEGKDSLFDYFANPVVVEETKVEAVPNYGTGFAPYFLSLGLFVGALLLSIVFPLREPFAKPKSAWQWFMSKFSVMAVVGVFQAIIAASILLVALKINVTSVFNFYLFSIITSVTFIALIQFLVTLFGDPGRFIAIVILILQLTTSAGTFPLELIPDTLQAFNAWLPMTYSVLGFKAVISSGDVAFMWQNSLLLLGLTVLLMGLTFGHFHYRFKRTYQTLTNE